MTNKQAIEKIEQAYGAIVDKLIWVAASIESDQLDDLLEQMDTKDQKKAFPAIFKSKHAMHYKNDLKQGIIDFGLYGFLAEVHFPECRNFSYENGKPVSWSTHRGCCRVSYLYAESTDLLVEAIEKEAKIIFQEYVTKDKKKATA